MESIVMCSEDQTNPAVSFCSCRFPLPSFCVQHISKHPIDSDRVLHFHLPLCAPLYIPTKEIKSQYEPWLYALRRAGKLLQENDEDLRLFEAQIETARKELIQEIDDEIAKIMLKVSSLRGEFNVQLETAIRETNAHALEQWAPETGSLAALLWHSSSNNQWSLKLFQLWMGKQRIGQALLVHIESYLPSFRRFNQYVEARNEPNTEQTHLDVTALQRENEHLKSVNASLDQKVKELETALAQHSNKISSLRISSENCYNQQRKAKAKLIFEHEKDTRMLKIEIARLKKSYETETSLLRQEIQSLKSNHTDVDILQEQALAAKTEGRYQASADTLREAWNLTTTNRAMDYQKTAAVGFALAEVLGLHLSQFAEAEKLITECLQITDARIDISEEMIRLRNLKAAILFHTDRNTECEAACRNTLETFASEGLIAEHYMAALYYLTFALCAQRKTEQAEIAINEWIVQRFDNENALSKFLRLCIRGRIARAKHCYEEAEDFLIAAAQVATKHKFTSIYVATNLYFLGEIYSKMDRANYSEKKLVEADRIFSIHFPGSIYSAFTLTWLAAFYELDRQQTKAMKKYTDARLILERFHAGSITTAVNLANLAMLFEDIGRVEEAERTFLDARCHHETYHPTSNEAAMNLCNLGIFYENQGRIEDAKACAGSARDIWKGNKSKKVREAEELLNRLRRIE